MANSSKLRMAVLMTWTAGRTVIPMLMALLLFGSRTRISDFLVSGPFCYHNPPTHVNECMFSVTMHIVSFNLDVLLF